MLGLAQQIMLGRLHHAADLLHRSQRRRQRILLVEEGGIIS